MDKVNAPYERRAFETRDEEEFYVARARGFQTLEEFRAFRKARETRNDACDYERRLTVLKLEVR